MRRYYIIYIGISLLVGCASLQHSAHQPLLGIWKFKNDSHGKQTLRFKADMTYEVDFQADGIKDIWGRYEYLNQRLRMWDESAAHITDCKQPGYYFYSVNNNVLTFELLVDQCLARQSALSVARIRSH